MPKLLVCQVLGRMIRTMFYIKTHLGHILKPGENALGYDLHGANSNDIELDKYKV